MQQNRYMNMQEHIKTQFQLAVLHLKCIRTCLSPAQLNESNIHASAHRDISYESGTKFLCEANSREVSVSGKAKCYQVWRKPTHQP